VGPCATFQSGDRFRYLRSNTARIKRPEGPSRSYAGPLVGARAQYLSLGRSSLGHPQDTPLTQQTESRTEWGSCVRSKTRSSPGAPVDSHLTGHTVRRWRSAILGEKENRVAPRCQPPGTTNASAEELQIRDVEPLLDLGALTISGTWMDLPQEVVDYIVFMLGNDLQSLKACSLTCKAMFVSTRCVIHRKICLTWEKNWELLTVAERQRYIRGERQGTAVRVLSSIAAHGLLQYARHLSISLDRICTPANLLPFNHHFQRFDRIQELNIYRLDTPGFLENFDTYFANFVPTLRSLHLEVPAGDSRQILDFICRFPHLEDLSLEVSSRDYHDWRIWKSGSSPVVKSMPHFRGRLRLRGITKWRGYLLQQLISLPGKRRFRFIDFRACSAEVGQPIVDACSGTLESVSITWRKFCE
jgi:hypothetical protein